jgi:hypothetical protein
VLGHRGRHGLAISRRAQTRAEVRDDNADTTRFSDCNVSGRRTWAVQRPGRLLLKGLSKRRPCVSSRAL